MKNNFVKLSLVFGLLFLAFSCSEKKLNLSDEEIRENLTGYWKIDEVDRPEFNDIRTYKFSTYAEYIEIDEDMSGYRIKLQPQLDSTYHVTTNEENFKIERVNDSIKMHYQTPMDNWTETLLTLSKQEFSVVNERGFIYKYKRFESLKKELDAHEKAAK